MALNGYLWNQPSGIRGVVRSFNQCSSLYQNDSYSILEYLRLKRSHTLALYIHSTETIRKLALIDKLVKKQNQSMNESTASPSRGRSGVYFMGCEVDSGLHPSEMHHSLQQHGIDPSLPPDGEPMPPPPRLASNQQRVSFPSNNHPISTSSGLSTEPIKLSREIEGNCFMSSRGCRDDEVPKGIIERNTTESYAIRPAKRPRFRQVEDLSDQEKVFLDVAPVLAASQGSVSTVTNNGISILPAKLGSCDRNETPSESS
jgi:hypothetical protein